MEPTKALFFVVPVTSVFVINYFSDDPPPATQPATAPADTPAPQPATK